MPGSSQWSLSFRFPYQNPVYASPLPHMRYKPLPSHSFRFYHKSNVWLRVKNMSSSLYSFCPPAEVQIISWAIIENNTVDQN
jgi:hypothetical protein